MHALPIKIAMLTYRRLLHSKFVSHFVGSVTTINQCTLLPSSRRANQDNDVNMFIFPFPLLFAYCSLPISGQEDFINMSIQGICSWLQETNIHLGNDLPKFLGFSLIGFLRKQPKLRLCTSSFIHLTIQHYSFLDINNVQPLSKSTVITELFVSLSVCD